MDQLPAISKPKKIAIVGAGLRGLASAAWLKSMGVDVRIFEKKSAIGGVWEFVHEEARINTPSYGYSFHSSNQWGTLKPSSAEILNNLNRMTQLTGLEKYIELSTPVEKIQKSESGAWTVNDREEEFDGLLVCPGFLGKGRSPPPELVARFKGEIARAYEVDPASLNNRHVVVVGSGSSALDMLALARKSECSSATLFIHPGVEIRDIRKYEPLVHAIASNPLLYKLTKRPGGKPAAVRAGIDDVLASSTVRVVRNPISRITGRSVHCDQSVPTSADVLIWCTGWESPVPSWVRDHKDDPTMVLAACSQCLDTAGFGFGTATVHAKALLATLDYGIKQQFASGSPSCDCSQDHYSFSRHILLNLVLFYLSQPARFRLLGRELQRGLKSNVDRMKYLDESRWASLLAFFNAPFGF